MKLNLQNLLYNVVAAFLLAAVIAFVSGVNPVIPFSVILGVGCCLPAKPATAAASPFAFMAIQREIWVNTIEENIFPDNSFMMQSRDDSEFLEGHAVKLNQAGNKPGVKKNRTQLPATVQQREDTTADYDIDEYTTDPVLVRNVEAIEANYNKRESVMFDANEVLKTQVAEGMAYAWTPEVPSLGVNIVRTTGAPRDPFAAFQLGAGKVSRKKMQYSDVTRAATILDSQDVPQEGRYMLIHSLLKNDILNWPEFKTLEQLGAAVLTNGAIGKLGGFEVFVRSSTVIYDGTTNEKMEFGEATSSNDNLSALCWQKNFVRRAFGGKENGGIDVFEDAGSGGNGNPQFYGIIISAAVRSGGRPARADERGIVAIVEDHA